MILYFLLCLYLELFELSHIVQLLKILLSKIVNLLICIYIKKILFLSLVCMKKYVNLSE